MNARLYLSYDVQSIFIHVFLCENIKILPNICDIIFGHGIDMVFSPPGGVLNTIISI